MLGRAPVARLVGSPAPFERLLGRRAIARPRRGQPLLAPGEHACHHRQAEQGYSRTLRERFTT